VTSYVMISANGQALSATGQLYNAFSGNLQRGQQMEQAGDIISGPLLGFPKLIATGNLEKAQRLANLESFVTAGAGLVDSVASKKVIQSAVDFGLSAVGLAGDDCN
jgi:hypothetical protein